MTFRTFFLSLSRPEREAYAQQAGTTAATLIQVAYGRKRVELGFADALVAVSGGALGIADIPLTDKAAAQHAIRSGD